jgi:DNA replication protein DnaC
MTASWGKEVDLLKEIIEEYCKQLRLGKSMVKNYQTINAESHEEFLAQLLLMEVKSRDTARKNLMIRKANFDVIKTFEGYEFEQVQIPSALTIEGIKNCEFIESKENLILYGSVGIGKTHLATALGVEACKQGKKVRFYRTAALVNQLIEAKATGELNRCLRQMQKIDLLICDELCKASHNSSYGKLIVM